MHPCRSKLCQRKSTNDCSVCFPQWPTWTCLSLGRSSHWLRPRVESCQQLKVQSYSPEINPHIPVAKRRGNEDTLIHTVVAPPLPSGQFQTSCTGLGGSWQLEPTKWLTLNNASAQIGCSSLLFLAPFYTYHKTKPWGETWPPSIPHPVQMSLTALTTSSPSDPHFHRPKGNNDFVDVKMFWFITQTSNCIGSLCESLDMA